MPNPIYTIGHSNHPLEAFIALLERHRIEEVADVRTYPRSRYNPCFNRDALERALARLGVRCLFLGAELGGRPADPACYDETGRVPGGRRSQASGEIRLLRRTAPPPRRNLRRPLHSLPGIPA